MSVTPLTARPADFPLDRGKVALLVIDMQRDFIEEGGFGAALGNDVSRLRAIIPTVARLLDGFRAAVLTSTPHKERCGLPRP